MFLTTAMRYQIKPMCVAVSRHEGNLGARVGPVITTITTSTTSGVFGWHFYRGACLLGLRRLLSGLCTWWLLFVQPQRERTCPLGHPCEHA
jgi:hypothetical protein